MYIQPDTTVRVLQNCPLDNSYDHTIYFSSKSAQSTYFIGLTKYIYNNLTYNRLNKGMLRIQQKADDLYNCNYMMFQNSAFGDKWFYAFITSVEYVNNVTSQITFEIDVMQTWLFDVSLEQCFVEREHVTNDSIGAHLLPEPVELGDYVYRNVTDSGHCDSPVCCIISNVTGEGEEAQSTFAANVLHGAAIWFANVTADGQNAIRERVNDMGGWDKLNENIIGAFMYYEDFLDTSEISMQRGASYQFNKPKNLADIDGYTPKNNKLFTFPYNFMLVTNDTGDSIEMHYEYFSGSTCDFNISGNVAVNPQIMLEPRNYKGVGNLRNEKLVLSGFPQCSLNIDAFKAWVAQTASNPDVAMSVGKSIAGGAAIGGGWGAAAGAATSLIPQLYSGVTAFINPPIVKGTTQADVCYAQGEKDFYFYPTNIQADFAKRIDAFFDVYGYSVMTHKTPNRNARPHWNYVKCRTTNIIGNAPADDVAQIVNIYNKGITFWRNGNEVGNYSLDNSI